MSSQYKSLPQSDSGDATSLQGYPISTTPPVPGKFLEFNGSVWEPADPNSNVDSVNGQTGVVILTASDVDAASQSLNNLVSTAINEDLIFDKSNALVATKADTTTQSIYFKTGDASGGNSGDVIIASGTATGTRGNVNFGGEIITVTSTSSGVFWVDSPAMYLRSGGGSPAMLHFYDIGAAKVITIRAPDSITDNQNWTWPAVAATAGQVLTDVAGNGVLSWEDASSGASFPLLAPDGSAAAPSYSFSNSTNTGVWYAGSNTVIFTANGANVLAYTPDRLVPTGGGILLGDHTSPWQSMSASGVDVTGNGQLKIYNTVNNNYIAFKVDGSLAASKVYQLPSTVGSDGDVLTLVNASTGELGWVTP